LAYSVEETLRLLGICRPKLYQEINAGRIVARKLGRRTIILAAEVHRYLDALPQIEAREAAA
jgi:excisionase family DNA binding protein